MPTKRQKLSENCKLWIQEASLNINSQKRMARPTINQSASRKSKVGYNCLSARQARVHAMRLIAKQWTQRRKLAMEQPVALTNKIRPNQATSPTISMLSRQRRICHLLFSIVKMKGRTLTAAALATVSWPTQKASRVRRSMWLQLQLRNDTTLKEEVKPQFRAPSLTRNHARVTLHRKQSRARSPSPNSSQVRTMPAYSFNIRIKLL